MRRKCFISFKTENSDYKKYIQEYLNVDMIDKSLNNPINSNDENYIMRKIREDYLSDSTVTIFLIGNKSSEKEGRNEQRYIIRELQASLYNGNGNTRNGILGVVLPESYDDVFKGAFFCQTCKTSHNWVDISDNTVIKEFSYNYYLPNDKCSYQEDDRYCVLVKWDDFCNKPNEYIETAFNKRSSQISNKVRVYLR